MTEAKFEKSVFTFTWKNYQFEVSQYHRAVWLKCWRKSPKKLIIDTPFKTFDKKILTYQRAKAIADECAKKIEQL